jgi:phosphoribosyl-AMP cyclohydrolase
MKFFNSKKANNKESSRPKEFKLDDNHSVIYNSHRLVPAIIQHAETGEVLKLGYLDHWALKMSLESNKVYLYRRSKQRVEEMGEDAGQEYKINEILLSETKRDLLFKVSPTNSNELHKDYTIKISSGSQ